MCGVPGLCACHACTCDGRACRECGTAPCSTCGATLADCLCWPPLPASTTFPDF